MERYKFPPMLGPASAHPEGTREWAECLGNELDYRVERAEEDGVDDLIPLIRQVISAKTPPWTVWPEPPCGTVDAYFRLCTGLTYEQVYVLIKTYKGDLALSLQLDTARAKEQASTMQAGRPKREKMHDDIMHFRGDGQGTSRSYLLRRIAREAPEILAAYERGEYKSVRAAADAAGIPRKSRAVRLRSDWRHASPEEREEFLDFLREQTDGISD